jgi:hypothetical protein
MKTVREGTGRGSCGYLPPLHIVVMNHRTVVTSVRNRGPPHPASTIIGYAIVSRPRSNSSMQPPVSRCFSTSVYLTIFDEQQKQYQMRFYNALPWERSRLTCAAHGCSNSTRRQVRVNQTCCFSHQNSRFQWITPHYNRASVAVQHVICRCAPDQ